jgi:hypothetical protein
MKEESLVNHKTQIAAMDVALRSKDEHIQALHEKVS